MLQLLADHFWPVQRHLINHVIIFTSFQTVLLHVIKLVVQAEVDFISTIYSVWFNLVPVTIRLMHSNIIIFFWLINILAFEL